MKMKYLKPRRKYLSEDTQMLVASLLAVVLIMGIVVVVGLGVH